MRSTLERLLLNTTVVKGRITEKHLSQAERTFPGIGELYRSLSDKPPTFLQLVWMYEGIIAELDAGRTGPHLATA